MKKYNKNIGNYGEDLAKKYMIDLGYKILDRNFQSRKGEIDIIAFKAKTLVFVEVKTRTDLKFGLPCESISISKIKNIISIAKYYIYIKKLFMFFVRFDVIEILLDVENNTPSINHIEDAFRES